MLVEALNYLVDLGQSVSAVEQINLPGGKLGLVMRDGEIKLYDMDRDPRLAAVSSLPSFVDWIDALGDDRDVEVIVGQGKLICKIDQELPVTDLCGMDLALSKAMAALKAWSHAPLGMRAVVKLLRGPLANTYDQSYLAVFRRLDFGRASGTKQKVGHTGESLGRSIETQAQSSEGEIPEVLTFEVPIYRLGVPMPAAKLRYAVDVDCDNESIAITEIGDCLTAAYEQAQADIAQWLKPQLGDSLILLGG